MKICSSVSLNMYLHCRREIHATQRTGICLSFELIIGGIYYGISINIKQKHERDNRR